MHDIFFILLENWLPLGLAAIAFFLVGLLIAKFIWGRYAHRLSFAVDENLNLASQWSALGASQRDLFKKLRSRWQGDRDAWEARLAETEEQLLLRDARITQLTSQLSSDGKAIPAELELDRELRHELANLRAELETREAELKELQAEMELRDEMPQAEAMPIGFGGTLEGMTKDEAGTDSELSLRIRDLEQDLIDTHDELHDVRSGYRKQVELVETLEARLIEQEASANDGKAERIVELEARLAAAEADGRKAKQLEALLKQRNRDGHESRSAREANRRLKGELEEAPGKAVFEEEALSLRGQLEEVRERLSGREAEVKKLQEELAGSRNQVSELQEKVERAEELDRRRISLQAELNDACHEMYDVRTALNERLDEIGLLEARIDELDLVEEEKAALEQNLRDTRHELSDLRIAYDEKAAELEQRSAQMEELEAMIEDRGAEVNDLSAELRQKRDQLRILRESLAEKEGELEALSFESDAFTGKLTAKEAFLNDQTRRIADLEQALAERYQELNQVRSLYDEEAKAARYHAARADHVEAELDRRIREFEVSDLKIATTEQALDEASAKVQELIERLNDSEVSIAELQEKLRMVSREKDDTLRELAQANERIEELEAASTDREQRISQFEADWKEAVGQSEALAAQLDGLRGELGAVEEKSGNLISENSELHLKVEAGTDRGEQLSKRVVELEQRIGQLQAEVGEAQQHREEARESIATLEESLRSSDERVLHLSSQIEEQDAELSEWKAQVDRLAEELARREKDLDEAKANEASVREQLQQQLEQVSLDRETLRAKLQGDGSTPQSLERLEKELESRERIARNLSEQRQKGLTEIERLRQKVGKRGDSIRELQNEVSSIMMQRADRDNEISMLKNKLRAVEAELDAARKATDQASLSALSDSNAIKNLEDSLQETLSAELSGGGGTSLDELPEQSGHHSPGAESPPVMNPGEEPAAAEPGSVGESAVETPAPAEAGEPRVLFEEGSSELSSSAKEMIDGVARSIRKGAGNLGVSVIGFAGAEGSAKFAETLSARRAEAVRERLLERGVAQSRLSVRGSGQDRRFTDARARRVELVLESKAIAETVN